MQAIDNEPIGAKARGEEAKKWYDDALKTLDTGVLDAINLLYQAHFLGLTLATNRLYFARSFNLVVHNDLEAQEEMSDLELFLRGFQTLAGINSYHSDISAFEYFECAAKRGFAPAQANLGRLYEFGIGTKKDLAKAEEYYQKSAKQGCAEGEYFLALLYKNYPEFGKSDELVLELYHRAATQNYGAALSNIGWMYANGRGVRKNKLTAIKWYQLAAEQGYAPAQANLAYYYEKGGLRIRKDYALAAHWYQSAAAQHLNTALYNLAGLYELGKGVSQDVPRACQLYKIVADRGSADAQFKLACIYEKGAAGVPANPKKTMRYYRRAAGQGHVLARENLRIIYSRTLAGELVGVVALDPIKIREDFQKCKINEAGKYLKGCATSVELNHSAHYHDAMCGSYKQQLKLCQAVPNEFFQHLMNDKLISSKERQVFLQYLFEHQMEKMTIMNKVDLAIEIYGCLSNPAPMATIDTLIAIFTENIQQKPAELELILAHLNFIKGNDNRFFYHFKKLIEANPSGSIIGDQSDYILSHCDADTLLSPDNLKLWLERLLVNVDVELSDYQYAQLISILAKQYFRELTEDATEQNILYVLNLIKQIPVDHLSAIINEFTVLDILSLVQRCPDESKHMCYDVAFYVLKLQADKICLTAADLFYKMLRELRRLMSELDMPKVSDDVLLHLMNRAAMTPDMPAEVSWYLFKLSKTHKIVYNPVEMKEEDVVKIFQSKLNGINVDNLPQGLSHAVATIKLCTTLTGMMDEIDVFVNANNKPSKHTLKKFPPRDPAIVFINKLLELRDEMEWLKKSDYPIRWENGCVLC